MQLWCLAWPAASSSSLPAGTLSCGAASAGTGERDTLRAQGHGTRKEDWSAGRSVWEAAGGDAPLHSLNPSCPHWQPHALTFIGPWLLSKINCTDLCTQLNTTESVTPVQYKVKMSKAYRKVSVRHTAFLLCAKVVFPLCHLDVIYYIGLYSAPIIAMQWTCLLKQVNAVFVLVIFFSKTAF